MARGNINVRVTNAGASGNGGRRQRNRQKKKGGKRGNGGPPIKGSGAYTIGGLAAKVHSYLKNRLPKGSFEKAGKAIGGRMGRGLSNITGVGDYVFNDIVHTPGLPTRVGNSKHRISNTEYVAELTSEGGTAFNLKTFKLNPFEKGVFPWASKIGTLYTKYRFIQLLFEFRSNTSDYAASGPLGTVIFAPIYNVGQTFQSKQQMEAATHAVSTKPSNSIMCGVECAPGEDATNWKWVRTVGQEATNLTDHGVFAYATSGLPQPEGTKLSLGEIWVHYTMELLDPILTTSNMELDGVAGGMVTWNSTAGRFATGLAGISPGAQTGWSAPAGYASTAQITWAAGRPVTDYFVSIDTTANLNWWFSRPGQYVVSAFASSTGSPNPNGLGPMYIAQITAGSGTVDQPDRVTIPQSAQAAVNVSRFVITVNAQDTRVSFSVSPLYTNLASVVPNGNTSGLNSGWVEVLAI
nr:MAG: hypothetical protein [Crogonang virus 18]